MLRRVPLPLVTILTLLLALPACNTAEETDSTSGSSDGAPAAQTSPSADGAPSAEGVFTGQEATAAARAQGTARVVYTTIIDSPDAGVVELAGEGSFDFAAETGRMLFDLSSLLPDLQGDQAEAEQIFVGDTLYLRMPFVNDTYEVPTPWLRISDIGEGEGALSQFSQGDPAQFLDVVAASVDLEDIGSETVNGVQTTHLEGEVDLEAVREAASDLVNERNIDAAIEQAGTSIRAVELWIDDDGRPWRFQMKVPQVEEFGGGEVTILVDILEYGVAVDAAPPPDDQITDASELDL